METFERRREQIQRTVAEQDLHGFLVTNPINVSYLTNFSGDSSYLLLGRSDCVLVSDGRYDVQLREECPGLPVHIRPPSIRITPATTSVIEQRVALNRPCPEKVEPDTAATTDGTGCSALRLD